MVTLGKIVLFQKSNLLTSFSTISSWWTELAFQKATLLFLVWHLRFKSAVQGLGCSGRSVNKCYSCSRDGLGLVNWWTCLLAENNLGQQAVNTGLWWNTFQVCFGQELSLDLAVLKDIIRILLYWGQPWLDSWHPPKPFFHFPLQLGRGEKM